MPYIYILHFQHPLGHAEHYSGCCVDLRARLKQHANGSGSRLCEVLIEKGIPWTLGALAQVTHSQMRRAEKKLKEIANAPRYCEVCTPHDPARIPDTMPYPISSVPFKPTSTELSTDKSTWFHNVRVRLTSSHEPPTTIKWVKDLMRKDGDALGWIPAGGDRGLNTLLQDGLMAIVSNNNQDVGYAAFTLSHDGTRLTIHQCVVAEDARLQRHGEALVTYVRWCASHATCVAKVRDDLAANHFWQAIGFQRQRTVRHKTSGNQINHYLAPPIIHQRRKEN